MPQFDHFLNRGTDLTDYPTMHALNDRSIRVFAGGCGEEISLAMRV